MRSDEISWGLPNTLEKVLIRGVLTLYWVFDWFLTNDSEKKGSYAEILAGFILKSSACFLSNRVSSQCGIYISDPDFEVCQTSMIEPLGIPKISNVNLLPFVLYLLTWSIVRFWACILDSFCLPLKFGNINWSCPDCRDPNMSHVHNFCEDMHNSDPNFTEWIFQSSCSHSIKINNDQNNSFAKSFWKVFWIAQKFCKRRRTCT